MGMVARPTFPTCRFYRVACLHHQVSHLLPCQNLNTMFLLVWSRSIKFWVVTPSSDWTSWLSPLLLTVLAWWGERKLNNSNIDPCSTLTTSLVIKLIGTGFISQCYNPDQGFKGSMCRCMVITPLSLLLTNSNLLTVLDINTTPKSM